MKAIKFLRLLVALSLMPTIFGCQTSSDSITVEIPASETPKDAALSKTVRQRLLSVDKTQFEHVQVVSKDGTVYLSGPVPSLDARQDAIKRAWEVGGVQSVVNRLEVEKLTFRRIPNLQNIDRARRQQRDDQQREQRLQHHQQFCPGRQNRRVGRRKCRAGVEGEK